MALPSDLVKKSEWKQAARLADAGARRLAVEVAGLKQELDRMQRELEAMRRDWQPIPIPHPYKARDPKCVFCDDPRDAPRHRET